MAQTYEYFYAYIETDGLCTGIYDTSNYALDTHYVPIQDDTIDYLFKYYWPIPTTITSHDDWQGLWYLDADHTQLFDEGNI